MDFQSLNRLLKCGKEFGHRKIREIGFTETEFMICSYISANERCSQSAVAKELYIDKTTIAKAVRSLEKKGMLLRTESFGDKRKNELELKPEGKRMIEKIVGLHDQWLKEVLDCLSCEEQRQLNDLMSRVLDAAIQKKPVINES